MRTTFARCLTMAMLSAGGMLALIGCASEKAELPPQMTQNLSTLRDQLTQGKAQIQTTCNAARDLSQRPQAQIEPQIDRLLKSTNALEDLAANHRTSFASSDEHSQAYFAQWEQQLKGMSASMQELGEDRRQKSMRSYDALKAKLEAVKQEFRPFMAQLQEVARYLKTDTTAAGVRAMSGQIDQAVSREKNLMAKADAAIEQIDAMLGGK